MFNRNLSKEEINHLHEKYRQPVNVPYAKTPEVFPYIWNNMPDFQQVVDRKQQKVQSSFSAAIVPLLRAAELVNVSGEVDKKEVLRHVSAALAMLGDASYTISCARRDQLRKMLTRDYTELCNREVTITDQLLGVDCEARIKKIKQSSRATIFSAQFTRPSAATTNSYKAERW